MRNDQWPSACFTLVLVLALLAAGGCSTPQPAKDLAAQGAATADQAQRQVEGFLDRAAQAYQRRETIVQELAEGETRDLAAHDFRAWIAAEAGLPTDQARIARIRQIADQSRAHREKQEAAVAAGRKKIAEAAGPAGKVPARSLAEAKRSFLNLAQELTAEEWLKFSWAYVRQVQTDLKALKEAQGDKTPPQ